MFEVYLGLVSDLDSSYLGLVETDFPSTEVYFGLDIVNDVRGSFGCLNRVVSWPCED